MNLVTKTLNKIFKTSNQQELDEIKPLVNEINNREKASGIILFNFLPSTRLCFS